MPQYLLLLRDDESSAPPPQEELQAIFKRFGDWAGNLGKSGKLRGGEKLRDGEGRVFRKSAKKADDGPHRSSNEVASGFFLIEAKDYDEAASIASSCPQLDFGSIEVREIEPM